ncbi:MAG: DNA replication/repair protein RecF [Marinilabiliaceae bacterium]|nr:DNA replication/repair protein RecF [Marinilabiliaceae bacterium]
MILHKISVINYRNIAQADLQFCPGINCFVGDNGAGKTNFLDAIYYLSFCKSFINVIDSQNVRHHSDFFVIQGQYLNGDSVDEIYCGLRQNQKKQFKRNKKEYPKLSDHIGLIPLVMISPADEMLIMEGSEWRRRFLDSVISQYDKGYLDTLIRYSRVLAQRNQILKDADGHPPADMLDVYDGQLAMWGAMIYEKRKAFINELLPVFNHHFSNISGGAEVIDIHYRSHLSGEDFELQLFASRQRDSQSGYTHRGIHRDDLEFTLGGHPLKKEGSQGQKKTFAIALRLAQFDFLTRHQGVKPLLLLDDIFDKLDSLRSKRLLELVGEDHFSQIFVSHTNRDHLEAILSGIGKEVLFFDVANGDIKPDNQNHHAS